MVPEASDYEVETWRLYAPMVKGCTVCHDKKWHNRWTITYRGTSPPYTHSVSYGPRTGLTVRAAVLAVLNWALGRHAEATGEACPWSLEA